MQSRLADLCVFRNRARSLLCALLLLPLASAFAQADLPAKMQGMYKTQSGRTGGATIELVSSAPTARFE